MYNKKELKFADLLADLMELVRNLQSDGEVDNEAKKKADVLIDEIRYLFDEAAASEDKFFMQFMLGSLCLFEKHFPEVEVIID